MENSIFQYCLQINTVEDTGYNAKYGKIKKEFGRRQLKKRRKCIHTITGRNEDKGRRKKGSAAKIIKILVGALGKD